MELDILGCPANEICFTTNEKLDHSMQGPYLEGTSPVDKFYKCGKCIIRNKALRVDF